MHDAGKIIAGLLIFVAAVTFPFWYNAGKASEMPAPVINPALKAAGCVEPADWMRKNHMDLLVDWRNMAVRDGHRTYTNSHGKQFEISLQNTCLNCHANEREGQFCTQCHTNTDVRIDCWSCHLQSVKGGTP